MLIKLKKLKSDHLFLLNSLIYLVNGTSLLALTAQCGRVSREVDLCRQ